MIAAVAFVALIALGVPIAWVLVLTSLALIAQGGDWILLESLPQQLFGGIETYALLALPLFTLLGELMGAGGIGRRLLALAGALLPPLKGGLAYVNLLANVLMASVLGSTTAQITVMSRLAVPEMERAGHPRELSATITAAGGLLAPILPPSMNLIVFAAIAQLPVAELFVAGVVPGLVMAGLFVVVIARLARRHDLPPVAPAPMAERGRVIIAALPALCVPLIAVGSILTGLATPTEAAAVSACAAVLVGMGVYRELRLRDIPGALLRAAKGAGQVLFLVACAQLLGWVLTYSNLPAMTARLLQDLTQSPLVFLLLLNLMLLALGMIMEPIPAIILTAPVLLPVATDVYGIDPVAFGIVTCVNLTLGLLTPPVGAGLYTAALLTGTRPLGLARRLIPFFLAVLVTLLGLTVAAANPFAS
ncbi:TRAP transporter large permease [Celeribacter indicus]|uniref:TRAP transporter large permease protein n=1 Tax=Celeribacter indicus TaxID=1208324 RepID=A0A0B5E1E1_9RHOB|nr:TRAP transporter large permease [Celeribacter indicus]AJE46826.1 TRAP transporter, DctM subunit subfamily protein [Celeribacter indicus]SDW80952.1 TRAP transporter, DctM subunit [Celeribacter indicus]